MKRNLLIISIIALLVIIVMPMASAASPPDARMKTNVHLLSGCDSPLDYYAECSVISEPVGTFTMSALYSSDGCGPDNTFKRIYSIRGLPPSTRYMIVLFDSPGGGINARFSGENHVIQLPIYTDAKGWLKATMPFCDYGSRNIFKTALESGTYWVGLIPA